ncbi:cytochrome P450, family 51, subfamily A [Calycina marina]|uniref:Cytochrome P450, family 51, subfamily A n=1 Tax=Calycina marina TaxID=1763456 RepID=A0A9P8CGV4_9HELO|nr:cytochrome P450, family 51, subfamily A [Calycina marina]
MDATDLLKQFTALPLLAQVVIVPTVFFGLAFVKHIVSQTLLVNKSEPPLVFSWVPFVGSTIDYGMDPFKFFFRNRKRYGDTFSFILVGRKHTVCLGTEGNNFVFNSTLAETSAADIYRGLTVPIFGKDVCYDCSPAKLMEQKKLMKYSLMPDKLAAFVPIFLSELQHYLDTAKSFQGNEGVFDVVESVGVITMYSAASALQGREVRDNLRKDLTALYHDLDKSFLPINFYMPGLPLPVNRRRDEAHQKIAQIYKDIIKSRRQLGPGSKGEDDMIWKMMESNYKDGSSVPDHEIANMMIGLLMAGQHNSYSVGAWILFHVANRPDIQEELYQEQAAILGTDLNASATRDSMNQLPLHKMVVRETLRINAPIHTVMRAVKSNLTITSRDPKTDSDKTYTIPTSHVLVSAPGVTAQSEEYFPNPEKWDPHRWETMGDVPENASSYYLPFGAGRHRCVGENFAYLQLNTIVAFMVRNYKFYPMLGEGVPATDYTAMITRPVLPARLRWERRAKI